MSSVSAAPEGPDLAAGVSIEALDEGGIFSGHVGDTAALLVRQGDEIFAIGATCTHYGGPLAAGLVEQTSVRCPWHHACFDLRTGEALRAPALDPIPCWRVEVVNGTAYVREKLAPDRRPATFPGPAPSSVVIIGGGAAGNAAAETLRREGYEGPVAIFSADAALPCDRPNLSKDFLAGKAPEEWTLLRSLKFYERRRIDVHLNANVVRIDTGSHQIFLEDGTRHSYGALLLATGAEPVRLEIPGAELPHVHYLRTLENSRALISRAMEASSAAIVGSGFIGLEVASSLRARHLEVHVIGRDAIPMATILGPDLGSHVRRVHEQNGVKFHLGRVAASIDEHGVLLDDGTRIEAGLVVVGVGVRPATTLAEQAGLAVNRGVIVDRFLRASEKDVFAAGDIARWPDPLSGESIRIEHFVVAERQGQTAARNMLGHEEPFEAVPFFWTEQHGLAISYVGHASTWDEVKIDGSIDEDDCSIAYLQGGRQLAVAVINRDLEGLRAEVALEHRVTVPAAATRRDCEQLC